MKKHLSTALIILVFLIGLSVLLYPSVSNYWNSFHQSRAIASYEEALSNIAPADYAAFWQEAEAYNRALAESAGGFVLTEEQLAEYKRVLDPTGSGIMGYIEIESIGISLPVYHTADDPVLQIAVGHIPGTSLPTGGESAHCALSAHRGLPSSRLFTDLDKLVVGDVFLLHVLDQTLAYEVDQIKIVLPKEVGDLAIAAERDYCTLITCTPYGINTHRLLVRGRRVDYAEAQHIVVSADAVQIEPLLAAPVVAAPMLLILLILLLTGSSKRKKRGINAVEKDGAKE